MRSFFILLISFVTFMTSAHAHSGKAKHHVLIDTDCGFDDMRAISIMLASNQIEVLGIITSEGILNSEQGYLKVKSMLAQYGHQGVPVGMGTAIGSDSGMRRLFCNSIDWGEQTYIMDLDVLNARDVILNVLENEENPVEIVCLGPLTNIAGFLKEYPEKYSEIESLFWFNEGGLNEMGFNYAYDLQSVTQLTQKEIPLSILDNHGFEDLDIGYNEIESLKKVKSRYSSLIISAISEVNTTGIKHCHMTIWDDLVPAYLIHPELFKTTTNVIFPQVEEVHLIDAKKLLEIYPSLYDEPVSVTKVLKEIPLQQSMYTEDVAELMDSIILKNGLEEFRIGIFTNELHGHLGIYAIIGAKMGLRGREYFDLGIDDIQVTSYAGCKPPISCMNDGLQVSTGGTVGHGLISIAPVQNKPEPSAEFSFKNKSVRLTLKSVVASMIKQDVIKGVNNFGLESDEYWNYIRQLALKYWMELDRFNIFEITEIK